MRGLNRLGVTSLSAGGLDGGKLLCWRTGDGDFVITIRADQDQMIHVRVRQQIFESFSGISSQSGASC
jgi:hypothetical protein